MTSEDRAGANAAAVTRFYEALAQGDAAAMASLLTDDAVLHVPGRSANTGDYRGREQVMAFIARAAETTGGTLRTAVHRVLADEEWAVALATYTATRPGHDPLENNLAHVMRLDDLRIAESWLHSRNQYEVDAFWS